LPVIGVWLLVIFFSGYVGIATVSAALAAAAYIGWTRLPSESGFFVFACLVALLIVYTHRENLRRMLHGNEARFGRFFGLKKG
jgi:glycerol-3-phosphate acyltransferase PlsY